MTRLPKILGANLLYLTTMLLVLVVGTITQVWSPLWGQTIIAMLILTPTALFLRWRLWPAGPLLRWRWPGRRLAAFSIVIGAGLWPLSAWLEDVGATVLGYSPHLAPEFVPTTVWATLLYLIASVILTPFSEELLFRGVVQRAYERYSPWDGIVASGILFALFQFRFQGLMALVALGLILSWLNWRSDSLVTALLAHMAFSGLAAGRTVLSGFRPDVASALPMLPLSIVGAAGVGICLIWFARTAAPGLVGRRLESWSWLTKTWPAYLAVIVYLYAADYGFPIGSRLGPAFDPNDLNLRPAVWQAPARWHYDLRDQAGRSVGGADCSLAQEDTTYTLECQSARGPVENDPPRDFVDSQAVERHEVFRWEAPQLKVISADGGQRFGTHELSMTVRPEGKGLELIADDDYGRRFLREMPANVLIDGEWPWRLSVLPFSTRYVRRAYLGWPRRVDSQGESKVGITNRTDVVVHGAETVQTPAGQFVAWRVSVDRRLSAWYDVHPPHTLLRYDDGTVSYLLMPPE